MLSYSFKFFIAVIVLLIIAWLVWSAGYNFGHTLGYLQGMTDTLKIETR